MGAHVTAPPDKRQPLFALLRPIAWKAGGQRLLGVINPKSLCDYSALVAVLAGA